MKGILCGLAAGMLMIISTVNAGENSCNELIQESEKLWMENSFDESDKKLDEVINICPRLAEAYWRKARNEFDRIEAIPRDKKPDADILVER